MAEKSIFHNVVKGETAYTQLLCNLLKRDPTFRTAFLRECEVDADGIEEKHVQAERRLDGCGQADILIDAPSLCVVIEIKTEVGRGKEIRQEIVDIEKKKPGYLWWLRHMRASASVTTRLIFLIPADWKHRLTTEAQLDGNQDGDAQHASEVKVLLWPQLLPVLAKGDDKLSKEFWLLIDERFGPIGFASEERELMFQKDFPLGTVVKLVKLLDDVRQRINGPATKLEIRKDEVCFYLRQAGSDMCWLYVGLWPHFWEHDQLSPICFGVEINKVAESVRRAFVDSLLSVYKQESIRFDGFELGFIPQEQFDESDALEAEIKPKLDKIWKSMLEASN